MSFKTPLWLKPRNWHGLYRRVFRKVDQKEVRNLVRKGMVAKYKSQMYMEFSEVEQFAKFYEKHGETLSVILNKLKLEYRNTSQEFFDIFVQCSKDFQADVESGKADKPTTTPNILFEKKKEKKK